MKQLSMCPGLNIGKMILFLVHFCTEKSILESLVVNRIRCDSTRKPKSDLIRQCTLTRTDILTHVDSSNKQWVSLPKSELYFVMRIFMV